MTINGVTIERSRDDFQTERWLDYPDFPMELADDSVVLFTAEVEMDARTGEYRLKRLVAEEIGVE